MGTPHLTEQPLQDPARAIQSLHHVLSPGGACGSGTCLAPAPTPRGPLSPADGCSGASRPLWRPTPCLALATCTNDHAQEAAGPKTELPGQVESSSHCGACHLETPPALPPLGTALSRSSEPRGLTSQMAPGTGSVTTQGAWALTSLCEDSAAAVPIGSAP